MIERRLAVGEKLAEDRQQAEVGALFTKPARSHGGGRSASSSPGPGPRPGVRVALPESRSYRSRSFAQK